MARKQFAAYFASSALAVSISTAGAPSGAYSAATSSAIPGLSHPTTIRSGCKKSATVLPSRRNSGLLTTPTSSRPSDFAIRFAVPTGTVDLVTMIPPAGSSRRHASTTPSTADSSGIPSGPVGVGRHRNTISASVTAAVTPVTNDSRPDVSPARNSSARPGSRISTSPQASRDTLPESTSAHITRCPSELRHAPVVSPTWPVPTTAILRAAAAPAAMARGRSAMILPSRPVPQLPQRNPESPLHSGDLSLEMLPDEGGVGGRHYRPTVSQRLVQHPLDNRGPLDPADDAGGTLSDGGQREPPCVAGRLPGAKQFWGQDQAVDLQPGGDAVEEGLRVGAQVVEDRHVQGLAAEAVQVAL